MCLKQTANRGCVTVVVLSRQARLSLVGEEEQGSAGPAEGATSNNGATYDTWYSSPGHGEVMGA